ncbi:MAG: hypothetical protein Q9167_006796 [Letrouitia subvulpina]
MKPYQYEPLSSEPSSQTIRLIELRPGEASADLECLIRHVSLADDPEYEAVSYCWGDPTPTETINCGRTTLGLNYSLSSALKSFRHKSARRTLWADAVCIDQCDTNEKIHQVRLMQIIYRKARRILVWLGDEDVPSNFSSLVQIMEKLRKVDPGQRPQRQRRRQDPLGYNIKHTIALESILKRPWFRRVWIIQEAALAKGIVIHYGQHSFFWEDVISILQYENGRDLQGVQNGNLVNIVRWINRQRADRDGCLDMTLIGLCLQHRWSLATDPRDKVYAFLGLCSDHLAEADYHLTVEEVLPSWVPDYNAIIAAFDLNRLRSEACGDRYKATCKSKWNTAFSRDSSMLKVEGLILDTITAIGMIFEPDLAEGPADVYGVARQIRSSAAVAIDWEKITAVRFGRKYITGEDLFDACWQILLGGCIPSEFASCKELSLSTYTRLQRTLLLYRLGLVQPSVLRCGIRIIQMIGTLLLFHDISLPTPQSKRSFEFRIERHVAHRRMIRTRRGYLGLAPALTEMGDNVALLKGCSTPVIVRPDGLTWKFIGNAYVHGIMNGEAFDEDGCQEMELA